MKPEELIKQVQTDGVKFISLQFTDIAGTVKSVDIPTDRLPYALESGIWFDRMESHFVILILEWSAKSDLSDGSSFHGVEFVNVSDNLSSL